MAGAGAGAPEDPTLFAIDTGAERCVLVLARGALVQTRTSAPGLTHLEHVLPLVEGLFAQCGVRPEHCAAFAFGCGPGSFTGLRIACTVAQGLALGAGRPVIEVGNLAALARTAAAACPATPGASRRWLVALDARMQQAYYAVFEEAGTRWSELAPPALCAQEELAAMVEQWKPDVCGGDAPWLRPLLAARPVALVPAVVEAQGLLAVARAQFAAGALLPAAQALPAYVRDQVAWTVRERALRKERAARAPVADA